jgi:hypothetical protein
MKLRAPEGCSSVSHCGRVLQVEADGSINVEDDAVAVSLVAHGFSRWPAARARDVEVMTRGELIAQVMDMTLQSLKATETEAIRAQLVKAQSATPNLRSDGTPNADVAPDAGKRGESDIESLNRPALFALLRKKKVRVVLPVTNEELRVAARLALQSEP